jgi:photosystem II stability/assembly factor-like uncharacterized protein
MRGFGGGRGLALLASMAVVVAGCQESVYDRHFGVGEIDYYDDLYTVSAVGSDHLWAAGYFGAIYRTTDGGKNWKKLPSGTEKSIYGISFADENVGWAVGRRGFIIHTTDGGETWERQSTPRQPPQHIFGIEAIDAKRAYAVGEWGGRYFTNDGGATWQDQSFLVNESHPVFQYLTEFELERFYKGEKIYDDLYLNDVFFLDDQHGWIAGEYGLTYLTLDGGQTWTKGQIQGEVTLSDVVLAEGESEIPRELWPGLFRDAEKLLEKEYLRVRVEGFMTGAELRAKNGETFLADERAEAVRDFLEGEGIGQERIRLQNTTPLDQESVDMAAFARTKLADQPIVKIEVVETPFLFDVKMADTQSGVISGLGGVILRTEDGGRTWTYSETDTRQALFSIGIGSSAILAVGEKGLARVSHDGGEVFTEPEGYPRLFTFMRDIDFDEPDRGWIVGAAGRVLRSSDGGDTWNQVLPAAGDTVAADGLGE